jgi:hypothetical protein
MLMARMSRTAGLWRAVLAAALLTPGAVPGFDGAG